MIYDVLDSLGRYRGMWNHLATAVEWFEAIDVQRLPADGRRIEIAGDRVYAVVEEYQTRARSDWVLEAHERYWDLQVVLKGKEMVRVLRQDGSGDADGDTGGGLMIDEPYDAKRDAIFFDPTEFNTYAGAGFDVVLGEGVFLALGPRDIHGPCRTVTGEASQTVRKLVVKVAKDDRDTRTIYT
ncbi:MAG: YhcH/YjgK/YiaL family protein [Planctomycetota bacterium]